MRELTIESKPEYTDEVVAFVSNILREYNCCNGDLMTINVAVDELFGNISIYAYDGETGSVAIQVDVEKAPLTATISFIDKGKPFDPLGTDDPDTSSSLEQRKIGGLGIFIVKNSVDDIHYEYKDGQNILTIKKTFSIN